MPVKRRMAKERSNRITPEAVAAYRRGENEELHLALGLKPWEPSPLEVDGPNPPSWAKPNGWTDAWPLVWALRLELERAAKRK